MKKNNDTTISYMKYLVASGLLNGTAHIKSSCNLTRKCFEILNDFIPPSLCVTQEKEIQK